MRTERTDAYQAALERECPIEYEQALILMRSGIVQNIANLIDKDVHGLHVDVHGRIGEIAMILADSAPRHAVALIRNPHSAAMALHNAQQNRVPRQSHIFPEFEEQPDGSVQAMKSLHLNTLMEFNLHTERVFTILCETIETQQGLQFLLNQGATISSMSWTFPRYVGRSYGYECGITEDVMQQVTARVLRDREQVLRLATILMPPGGQLIIAGDTTVHDDPSLKRPADIRETQKSQHDKLEHWKDSWEPDRGLLVRSMENKTLPLFGQEPQMSFNGASVLEFRRKGGIDLDAIEESNRILGIGAD